MQVWLGVEDFVEQWDVFVVEVDFVKFGVVQFVDLFFVFVFGDVSEVVVMKGDEFVVGGCVYVGFGEVVVEVD